MGDSMVRLARSPAATKGHFVLRARGERLFQSYCTILFLFTIIGTTTTAITCRLLLLLLLLLASPLLIYNT